MTLYLFLLTYADRSFIYYNQDMVFRIVYLTSGSKTCYFYFSLPMAAILLFQCDHDSHSATSFSVCPWQQHFYFSMPTAAILCYFYFSVPMTATPCYFYYSVHTAAILCYFFYSVPMAATLCPR